MKYNLIKKVVSCLLAFSLLLGSAVVVFAKESDVVENFDAVELIDDLNWEFTSVSGGQYALKDMEGRGKVLHLKTPNQEGIQKATVSIPYANAKKLFAFDFMYEGSFQEYFGIYFTLYRDSLDNDGLGGAIMPEYSVQNLMINAYVGANLFQDAIQYTAVAGTWYTFVAELTDHAVQMKLYPAGEQEPQDWMLTQLLPLDYVLDDTKYCDAAITLVTPTQVDAYIDNLRVTEPVVEPVMTDPQYTLFVDNFDEYPIGSATKDVLDLIYQEIPSASIAERADTEGNCLRLEATADSGNLVLTCPVGNKEVQFDFLYDHVFVAHGGLYTTLHQEPNGHNYYFSITPELGQHLIISDEAENLKAVAGPAFQEGQWYTAKARMWNKAMYVKVWEAGQSEPEAWNLSYSFNGHGYTENAGDRIKFRAVEVGNTPNMISIDHLAVRTWEELALTTCSVSLNSEDLSQGTVSGMGTYYVGAEVSAVAIPAPGYGFEGWYKTDGTKVSDKSTYRVVLESDLVLTARFVKLLPRIKSFMATGMTLLPVIDEQSKTVTVTFASDVDLSAVQPYFYLENGNGTEAQPYEWMDLSSGSAAIGEWTVIAKQNPVMKTFYVDVEHGNDSYSGATPEQAFKTIEKAKQAVRAIEQWSGDIIVEIAAGEYVLNETLKFDESDTAPDGYAVVYRSNADAVLSSGIHLRNWTPSSDVTGAWEIAVPENVSYSRDLFVDGEKATLARTAPEESIIPVGWNLADDPDMEFIPATGYRTTGAKKDFYTWRNPSDIEFVYEAGWTYVILPVASITQDGDSSNVVMLERPFKDAQRKGGMNIQDPNYIQNALELLDEPGEWYFDRTAQKIYYIPQPGQNPNDLKIVLPTLDKLIEVEGTRETPVSGLALQGLCFEYTSFLRPHTMGQVEVQANAVVDPEMVEWLRNDCAITTPCGISASYVQGMRVDACTFQNLSAGGFEYTEGAVGCTVTNSTFTKIGASGVQVGGIRVRDAHPYDDVTYNHGVLDEDAGADPKRVTEDILIQSNVLDHTGADFKGSIGIFVAFARDVTVAHNQLSNLPYSGISTGWGWGMWDEGGRSDFPGDYKFNTPTIQERYVIENNDISGVCQRLADGGAIYTLSLMPGSILRGNVMHDNPVVFGGIYNDEASGGFTDFAENITYRVAVDFNYHRTLPEFEQRYFDTLAVMHDNFFGVASSDNLLYQKIIDRAGLLPNEKPVKPSNKDELKEVINNAKNVDTSKYTEDSVKTLKNALVEAEQVFAAENATKEQIEAATTALNAAITALKTRPETLVNPDKPVVFSPVTLVKPSKPALPFTDVADDAWHYDAVEYVYGEGLMNGVGGGKFNPTGDVTRGMVATILYRMEGEPRVYSDGTTWWSDARAWAMENSISDGTSMDGKITREQLAAMLYRYAKFSGFDTSARANLNKFADSSSVSSWAVEAMQWANAEGIVTGKPGNKLDPKGLASRAEVATMFMRFCENIK